MDTDPLPFCCTCQLTSVVMKHHPRRVSVNDNGTNSLEVNCSDSPSPLLALQMYHIVNHPSDSI